MENTKIEMKQKRLAELTDEELLEEGKRNKSTNIYDAIILGVLIGIATYSSIKNGFGLLTFLPLVYAPLAVRNKNKSRELEKLLKARNLK